MSDNQATPIVAPDEIEEIYEELPEGAVIDPKALPADEADPDDDFDEDDDMPEDDDNDDDDFPDDDDDNEFEDEAVTDGVIVEGQPVAVNSLLTDADPEVVDPDSEVEMVVVE